MNLKMKNSFTSCWSFFHIHVDHHFALEGLEELDPCVRSHVGLGILDDPGYAHGDYDHVARGSGDDGRHDRHDHHGLHDLEGE